jgi:plastocyanin
MKFGPASAGIRIGDTISWINRDFLQHTATARDKSFNVELPPKSSGESVIRHSGTIAFYCICHPGMTGSLKVENDQSLYVRDRPRCREPGFQLLAVR